MWDIQLFRGMSDQNPHCRARKIKYSHTLAQRCMMLPFKCLFSFLENKCLPPKHLYSSLQELFSDDPRDEHEMIWFHSSSQKNPMSSSWEVLVKFPKVGKAIKVKWLSHAQGPPLGHVLKDTLSSLSILPIYNNLYLNSLSWLIHSLTTENIPVDDKIALTMFIYPSLRGFLHI